MALDKTVDAKREAAFSGELCGELNPHHLRPAGRKMEKIIQLLHPYGHQAQGKGKSKRSSSGWKTMLPLPGSPAVC